MTLLGEAKREAPVRTEPHPTRSFALPAPEASRVNPTIHPDELALIGFNPGNKQSEGSP